MAPRRVKDRAEVSDLEEEINRAKANVPEEGTDLEEKDIN